MSSGAPGYPAEAHAVTATRAGERFFVLSRLLQYTIGEKGMKAIERKFSRQSNKIGFFRGCLLKRLLNCQQGINTANHSCRIGTVNLRNSLNGEHK